VFVASPGDVSEERDALAKLVRDLNLTIHAVAPEKGIALELVRWETHAFPAPGRPQSVINEEIGKYDIFVGIMWTRFGTPSGVAESGTEEEYNLAYESWRRHGKPHIMFYFCQAPSPPPASDAAARQLLRVVRFRERLSEKALVWVYQNHSDFVDTVLPHLLRVLAKAMAAEQSILQSIAFSPPTGDVDFVKSELLSLSAEYARVRSALPSGDARTLQMEMVVTKMRTVASSAPPAVLRLLANSRVPGHRLAAIATLQVAPQAEYVEWLGDRCLEGQPFVAYHAAVALLVSVRTLDLENKAKLESVIRKGLAHLKKKQGTDRYKTLSGALEELAARCP